MQTPPEIQASEAMQTSPTSTTNPHTHHERITSIQLYTPHLSYKAFMVPAIMAFLLTIISGFLSALNIVREKKGA